MQVRLQEHLSMGAMLDLDTLQSQGKDSPEPSTQNPLTGDGKRLNVRPGAATAPAQVRRQGLQVSCSLLAPRVQLRKPEVALFILPQVETWASPQTRNSRNYKDSSRGHC